MNQELLIKFTQTGARALTSNSSSKNLKLGNAAKSAPQQPFEQRKYFLGHPVC